ncbi:MAG: hypothetical protein ACJ71Y_02070 [Blastococcus sp.]
MTFSTLSHLECSRDGSRHDADVVQGTSPLGAPLLARYDLDQVSRTQALIDGNERLALAATIAF